MDNAYNHASQAGNYKSLIVWQKSIALVKEIYALTSRFPNDERFGIVSQMRRAAVSIPSNIAEGQARRTTPDFVRFISNAEGSLAELDTQLIISIDLEYCDKTNAIGCFSLIEECRKMLNALRRTLITRNKS
jgi:four helix bundle protein